MYIGGEIVSFWRDFVSDWQLPDYIKSRLKMGTFFWRKSRGNSIKKKGLPKMLRTLSLSIDAQELRVTHFTYNVNDPGGGLSADALKAALQMQWSCNEEFSETVKSDSLGTSYKLTENSKRLSLKEINVNLDQVIVRNSYNLDSTSPNEKKSNASKFSSENDLLQNLVDQNASPRSSDSGMNPYWQAEQVTIFRSSEGKVPADPSGKVRSKQPLKVKVINCNFLTDLELRDQIWATIEHLISAFAKKVNRAESGHLILPRRQSNNTMSPFQRERSDSGLRPFSQSSELSTDAENNDLLNLLLRQREAAGEAVDGSSNLPSPQHTVDLDEQLEGDSIEPISDVSIEPLNDMASDLKYEVEVVNLQMVLHRDTDTGASLGRLMLAAHKGLLQGMVSDNEFTAINITKLCLEDVQAYVSTSSIDPHSSIQWLELDNANNLIYPSLEAMDSTWRRIFNPIDIDLRHSKNQISKTQMRTGVWGTNTCSSPLGALHGRSGEELAIKARYNYFSCLKITK